MSMKTFLPVLLLIIALSAPAFAGRTSEHDLYLQYQSFGWKEFGTDGIRLLKESGPLFGAGYAGKFNFENKLTLRPKAEIFGGSVTYDGQACDIAGSCFPITSDTGYFGIKGEGDLGLRFMPLSKMSLEPFAGLGLMWWSRDIKSTPIAAGYEERWRTLYGRLGLRGDLIFTESAKAFGEAAVKLPIYNIETAYLSDAGLVDVDLKPGKRTSLYAEAGMKYKKFKASLFYEGLRFAQSDIVPIGGGVGVFQPESEGNIYGVNAGISF